MSTVDRKVLRYQSGSFETVTDQVVTEKPLTVSINGQELVTMLSLGEHPDELAVGFLRSEGFLKSREQIEELTVDEGHVDLKADVDLELIAKLSEKRTVTSGCGKGSTFHSPLEALHLKKSGADVSFSPDAILERMRELEGRSELFKLTGGVHNAALATPGAIELFRHDIGRHNAVDMVGGRALLDGLDITAMMLLVSGRVSSEIARKAAAMGISVVISRSAPTDLALRMAEELGITVVGYARTRRFNVYTHPERVAK